MVVPSCAVSSEYVIPSLGIRPLGLVCICLMVFGYVGLRVWRCWVDKEARKYSEYPPGAAQASTAPASEPSDEIQRVMEAASDEGHKVTEAQKQAVDVSEREMSEVVSETGVNISPSVSRVEE